MIKRISRIVATLTLGLSLIAGPAMADDKSGKPKPPPSDTDPVATTTAAPSSDAAAEVKAGTGISKREAVGEADSFAKGTKVWVWTSVKGAKGEMAKMVWKKGEKQIWEKEFEVKSGRYRTWSRRKMRSPGSYTVEVQGADGSVMGSVSFTIE